jgi:hypothetical protein
MTWIINACFYLQEILIHTALVAVISVKNRHFLKIEEWLIKSASHFRALRNESLLVADLKVEKTLLYKGRVLCSFYN